MNEWREAASLILVTKSDQNSSKSNVSENKFHVLMAKRNQNSSFYASAFVFPGGHLELNDFSSLWWDVFKDSGFSRDEVLKVKNRIKGLRPPIMSKCLLLTAYPHANGILPVEIALRICAIRETFEETGILLVKSKFHNYSENSNLDIRAWQQQCYHDSKQFVNLCRELKVSPNIWELYEWWNWLTPKVPNHKRFDTMFYIYFNANWLNSLCDDQEVSQLQWISPIKMLKLHDENKVFLAPPQVYELSRLASFRDYQALKQFSEKRETLGVVQWLPHLEVFMDGAALILPGDEVYFKTDNTKNKNVSRLASLTEARSKLIHFNRIELNLPNAKAYCNIITTCGQCSPITYSQVPVFFSSL